jgi:serine protease Do
MMSTNSDYAFSTHGQQSQRGPLWLLLSALLICLLVAIPGRGGRVLADGMPGGNVTNPVVRAVDIAEPAVVRIFTTGNGHLTVQLADGNVVFPQQGSYQLTFSGSGTFITSHGDILTADHVINPPVQDPGVQQAFDTLAAPDVAQYINQHHLATTTVTPDQVNQELQSGQLASTPRFDSLASTVFLSTSYSGPLTATSLQNVPSGLFANVDKIEQQSSFNQADVAIIHVPMDDTPSVPLGDSSNVQQQDQLTIIGFPGNGDVSQRPTDLLTPSVNQIFVSSIKTTDSGAPVIQVGGNVEHGDSGGPALNSSGAVVGIVSFGIVDSSGTSGTSFLQASNSARSLIQALKLDTAPGPFEQAWTQAFDDYASTAPGHWHKAASEFQQLANHYPLFKAVTPYLNYAQGQAAHEKIPTGNNGKGKQAAPASGGFNLTSLKALAITVGVVLVLLLLLAALVMVVVRRGKREKRAQPPRVMTTSAQQVAMPPAIARPMPPMPVPPVTPASDSLLDGMSAFGAPTRMGQSASPLAPMTPPGGVVRPMMPTAGATQAGMTGGTPSSGLRTWPCGHMNRPNARFCSVCGEPAPTPPQTRRVEQ